jgi:hypothetical protein
MMAKMKKMFCTRGAQKLKSEVGVSVKIIHQTISWSVIRHVAPSLLSPQRGMTQKVEWPRRTDR